MFSMAMPVTFDRPTAARILPQFASLANNAVLTNGECATVYAPLNSLQLNQDLQR